jgi:hypothetical protein
MRIPLCFGSVTIITNNVVYYPDHGTYIIVMWCLVSIYMSILLSSFFIEIILNVKT